jgi:hypothetical protein
MRIKLNYDKRRSSGKIMVDDPNLAGDLLMNTIAQIAQAMQTVLTTTADRLGRKVGFVQRTGKLDGSHFVQTLVFAFMDKPQATYEDLSQSAAAVGVEISPQGLEQRFTDEAVELMQQVLHEAVRQSIECHPAALPVLQRFNGVYLRDSTVVSLPVELAEMYPGVGGSNGQTAAVKLQVRLNYSTGQLEGPVLHSGRTQDQSTPFQDAALPPGALSLADLGFFNLGQFNRANEQGVYYLARLKFGTKVFTLAGECLDLVPWLNAQGPARVDLSVQVGQQEQVQCRLLAVRVPQEVADQRRRQLHEYARKKQVPLSDERLAWADWTLLITNAPVERLTLPEALILLRVRWQIELLFKLWKSHAHIDEWRSHKPPRILCELLAKLIGVLILQWILLTGLWQHIGRSRFKAARLVQRYITAIALVLTQPEELMRVLTLVQKSLLATCRTNKRRKRPSTYQLLLQIT